MESSLSLISGFLKLILPILFSLLQETLMILLNIQELIRDVCDLQLELLVLDHQCFKLFRLGLGLRVHFRVQNHIGLLKFFLF